MQKTPEVHHSASGRMHWVNLFLAVIMQAFFFLHKRKGRVKKKKEDYYPGNLQNFNHNQTLIQSSGMCCPSNILCWPNFHYGKRKIREGWMCRCEFLGFANTVYQNWLLLVLFCFFHFWSHVNIGLSDLRFKNFVPMSVCILGSISPNMHFCFQFCLV